MIFLRKYTLTFLLTALFPITVPSAELPTLPASKNISSGSLANGIKYYIISNPTCKGTADIALVQKAGSQDEGTENKGMATVNARGSLSDLPHFMERTTPFAYLKRKSMYPRDHGFVDVLSDASVYRFENIMLARKEEVIDSTLLLVFDIIGQDGGKMGANYAPENQAVIISGDINESEVRGKMDMLSMFVARRQKVRNGNGYHWQETEGPELRSVKTWDRNMVSAEYRYPRTAESDMATVLPLVTSRYASELEILLRKRLSTALARKKIPYSSIDFSYQSSADRQGDEIFKVGIVTSEQHLESAAAILAETLASIDSHGVSPEEFRDIENELNLALCNKYGSPVIENARYVDKCISAFLYNASLSSDQDNLRFFADRDMDVNTSAGLFNNFVAALIDRSRNLTIVCETTAKRDISANVKEAFSASWPDSPAKASRSFNADTVSLRKPSGKTKIRMVSPEPLYGGEMWTFSNGMKVIYKRVPGSGNFHYSWLVKGGFSNMQGLKLGESAYLGDILSTYKIAGMPGADFMEMGRSNGVSMEISTSLSEFSARGSARSSKINLLMKMLLSIAESRSPDPEAYSYFRSCEEIRNAVPSMPAKLDSIMNRDLTLSEHKRPVKLADDLQSRAGKYFDETLSRTNDGVLIIVGDIDVNALRKTLLQYIGSFKTDKAYALRSRDRRNAVTSRTTVFARGLNPAIGISLSAPINFTAENYMAANIAADAMQDAVASAAGQAGWTLSSSKEVRMFPEESLSLELILTQASAEGLPASMMRVDSSDVVLALVRNAIEKLGSKGLGNDALKVGKTMLSNYFESWRSDPEMMTRMLALRYSYGKDLVTDYKSKISGVNAAHVNPILSALSSGGIAEYVVRKEHTQEYTEPVVKDMNHLEVEPLKPIPGSFYYPFDGSTVPVDTTIDLHTLEITITPPESADSLAVTVVLEENEETE